MTIIADLIAEFREDANDWGLSDTLSAGINNSVAEIPLTGGYEGFVSGGQHIWIDNECLYVYDYAIDIQGNRNGNVLCRRAQRGTTAASHLAGATVRSNIIWSDAWLTQKMNRALDYMYYDSKFVYQRSVFSFSGFNWRAYDLAHAPTGAASIMEANATTNELVLSGHKFANYGTIQIVGLDSFNEDTFYYVVNADSDSIKVSATPSGTAIDIIAGDNAVKASVYPVVGISTLTHPDQIEEILITVDAAPLGKPKNLSAARLVQDGNSVIMRCNLDLTGRTIQITYNHPIIDLESLTGSYAKYKELPVLWAKYKAASSVELPRVRTTPYNGEGGVVPGTLLNTGSFYEKRFWEQLQTLAMERPGAFTSWLRQR